MDTIRERRNAFIGRDGDLEALTSLLARGRLVTITGVGGVGKTRLAIRAANVHAAVSGIDAYFVGLESVEEADRVPLAVVRGLGLADHPGKEPREVVIDEFGDRHAVIVLDNCEHLIDAVALFIDDLLKALPLLTVLATSRRPLDLDGERVYPLPPLPIEGPGSAVPDAVALLFERARDADAHFDVDAQDPDAVAALCRALDGVPLSIELAAVRLRTLSVAEMIKGLGSRFALLRLGSRGTVERQRTLRAVVDWSYELCTPLQQHVWQALSVFSGGFDVEAAVAVCVDADADAPDVLDAIGALVAQSLVEPSREPGRHRLLEIIREYGREKAREAGIRPILQGRHFAHFRRRLQSHREHFYGPGQAEALARLREERLELQSALTFASSGGVEPDDTAGLVLDLRYHWAVGGFLREGRTWSERALAWTTSAPVRVDLLLVAAWLALVQGDLDGAAARLDEAEAGLPALTPTDRARMGIQMHRWRGSHALFSGDLERARLDFSASIAGSGRQGDETASLLSRFQLTIALAHGGGVDPEEPARVALRICEQIDESWMRSHALWSLSVAALVEARIADARALIVEAISVDRDFDDYLGSCLMLETWCVIASRDGRMEQAGVLLGALTQNWRHVGSDITAFGPHLATAHETCVRTVREALGAAQLDRVLDRGARLDLHAAVAYALDASASIPLLSPREQEVAAQVHRGKSNREIASDLVISVRTVETHVQHIFTKLGMTSRAQVAAWYERGSVSNT